MKRKLALLLFAALVSASLFAGCQNKDTEKPDLPENTENTDAPNTDDVTGGEAGGTEQSSEAAGNGEAADSTDPDQKTDATETAGFAEAYLETVNAFNDEYKNAENTVYNLIDFDGKGSKELVIFMPGLVSMYTYANGRVYTLIDGFGYGVGGNGGYDYIPGGNVLRGFNNDYAGAVCYENYYHVDEKLRFKPFYEKDLFTTLFEDKNHNQMPDDDEPIDTNATYYYYGENELSKEDYASMQVEGEYRPLVGEMTFDELKAALTE